MFDSDIVNKDILKSAPEAVKTVVDGSAWAGIWTSVREGFKETMHLFSKDAWRKHPEHAPTDVNLAVVETPKTNGIKLGQ